MLIIAGVIAIGLQLFNVLHEFHAAQVDLPYTIVSVAVSALWLASLVTAFFSWRPGIFVAGLLAFLEFGVVASAQFVSGPAALSTLVSKEGLPLATADMAIVPACALAAMSAAACWTNPRQRNPRLEMLPLLLVAVAGAVLVILQATDDLRRKDFGSATPEDGAFAAAVLAAGWLAGGLWISRVRRTGALLIAIASFGVAYSFITLHLLKGTTSVSQIASQSGVQWAIFAAAAAVLAAASFLASLYVLLRSLLGRRPQTAEPAVTARRRA